MTLDSRLSKKFEFAVTIQKMNNGVLALATTTFLYIYLAGIWLKIFPSDWPSNFNTS